MTGTIDVRIFLGYLLNSEIKMYLNQSSQWKEVKWQTQQLVEAHFEEKTYIGFFIENALNDEQIKKKECEVKVLLQLYCPKLNLDKYDAYLFPQIFLS
jgi:hypothetical protein